MSYERSCVLSTRSNHDIGSVVTNMGYAYQRVFLKLLSWIEKMEEAIQKELQNIRSAFHFLSDDETVPIGYKKIPCHVVFDVKMDFTRKARFVAGGHMTDPPSTITYSSVVSRESVRIAFLLAA
jgi:hypothetical protein